MRRLGWLLCGIVLAVAVPLLAETITIKHVEPDGSDPSCPSGVCINSVTCSSAVNTGWVNIEGVDSVTFGWKLTDANDSVSAVNVTCETAKLYSTALGSGYDICGRVAMDADATSTMACPHTWSFANAEADTPRFTVDNLNDKWMNCTFTCAGTPAAADLIYAEILMRSP